MAAQGKEEEGRDLDNGDWMLLQVKTANATDRLDYLAECIAYDKWEDEPYTKDEELMREIRSEWEIRVQKIKQGDING